MCVAMNEVIFRYVYGINEYELKKSFSLKKYGNGYHYNSQVIRG